MLSNNDRSMHYLEVHVLLCQHTPVHFTLQEWQLRQRYHIFCVALINVFFICPELAQSLEVVLSTQPHLKYGTLYQSPFAPLLPSPHSNFHAGAPAPLIQGLGPDFCARYKSMYYYYYYYYYSFLRYIIFSLQCEGVQGILIYQINMSVAPFRVSF
jgi:hypothetical protein